MASAALFMVSGSQLIRITSDIASPAVDLREMKRSSSTQWPTRPRPRVRRATCSSAGR